jgi:transposase
VVGILVCTEAIDVRQWFDRLARLVRSRLGEDPQTGSLSVLANRNATRLKARWLDSNGYCLL